MASNWARHSSGSTFVTSTGGGGPELLIRMSGIAELAAHRRQRLGHAGPVAEVRRHGHRPAATLPYGAGLGLELGRVAGQQRHRGAFRGQRLGDGQPEPLAGPAHQRHFVVEHQIHRRSPNSPALKRL
jgi:hypothetical protein